MNKILAIYGAGGSGRDILEMAKVINKKQEVWGQIVFIDDVYEEKILNNIEVYNFDTFVSKYSVEDTEIIISLGEPKNRQKLYDKVTLNGYKLATLIHPNVDIPEFAKIGKGCLIQSNVYLSNNVIIEDNTLIHQMALIGHDTIVGKHCVISAQTLIAGGCNIGELSYIALGVPVRENLNIGRNTVVGMGSIVLRDIPDDVIAMGNPARAIQKNDGKIFNK